MENYKLEQRLQIIQIYYQNSRSAAVTFHKKIILSDEAHFWLNGYVNKQNSRIWSSEKPEVFQELPLHPKKN